MTRGLRGTERARAARGTRRRSRGSDEALVAIGARARLGRCKSVGGAHHGCLRAPGAREPGRARQAADTCDVGGVAPSGAIGARRRGDGQVGHGSRCAARTLRLAGTCSPSGWAQHWRNAAKDARVPGRAVEARARRGVGLVAPVLALLAHRRGASGVHVATSLARSAARRAGRCIRADRAHRSARRPCATERAGRAPGAHRRSGGGSERPGRARGAPREVTGGEGARWARRARGRSGA